MIKKQYGVTLIELMVSMMLGLGLVAGISQLFIQSQKSFALQRNLSDMTDDGAFVLEALAKAILLAGYSDNGLDFYCQTVTVTDTVIATGVTTTPYSFSSCDNIKSTQTDVLGSGLDLNCSSVINATTNATATNQTTTTITTKTCETIKGNTNSLVFRFALANQSQMGNSLCTTGSPAIGSTVAVRIHNDVNVLNCESTTTSQPIISDVEKLEFRYGIRNTQGDFDFANDTYYYTTADQVTDWSQVFGIKIFILMRSADDNLTRSKGYYYDFDDPTKKITMSDHRLYKVFSKTIYLRAVEK